MFAKWDDKWLLNIPFIDEQHKIFINTVNDLHDAIINNKGQEILKNVDSLNDFAHIHFSTEEWFFKKHDYPGQWEHIKEHRQIANKFDHLLKNYKNIAELKQCMEDIKAWVVSHFGGTDQAFGEYIKKLEYQ